MLLYRCVLVVFGGFLVSDGDYGWVIDMKKCFWKVFDGKCGKWELLNPNSLFQGVSRSDMFRFTGRYRNGAFFVRWTTDRCNKCGVDVACYRSSLFGYREVVIAEWKEMVLGKSIIVHAILSGFLQVPNYVIETAAVFVGQRVENWRKSRYHDRYIWSCWVRRVTNISNESSKQFHVFLREWIR